MQITPSVFPSFNVTHSGLPVLIWGQTEELQVRTVLLCVILYPSPKGALQNM